ncbi:MAG: metal-binding protein [Thioalkalivibrio sp.]|nr:MAG: metal-binding protein [Thioalkalivibrio sp.]
MSRLPVSLDPFQPRALDQQWQDDLGRRDLPRLAAAVPVEAPLEVHVRIGLVRGLLGEIRLQGVITGELGQECQRCLQPMSWTFSLAPDVVVAAPEGLPEGLGDGQDVLELEEDGLLRPAEFVEEEILLALPLSPRHRDCGAHLQREFEPGTGGGQGENPFAVLKKLRR